MILKINIYNILLILFFTLAAFLPGYSITISDQAEISILTSSPGEELYTTFGHCALRIRDQSGLDITYNYGTFDFKVPHFYMKFIRGTLNYELSITSFDYYLQDNIRQNRSIQEQVLNLSYSQKKQIVRFLDNNYLPANRYYRYDFFYDNCSTRIRDVLSKTLKSGLVIDLPEIKGKSFRDLYYPYLKDNSWARLGIDLVLGLPADVKLNTQMSAFLPDYLNKTLEKASVKIYGKTFPLVKETRAILTAKPVIHRNSVFQPLVLLWALFILTALISLLERIKHFYSSPLDFILFLISGLSGFLIFFMWFFTDHSAVVNNLNILWAVPFNLFFCFFLFRKNIPGIVKKYFLGTGVLSGLILTSWLLLPQKLDVQFFPLILCLAMRGILIGSRLQQPL